MTTRTPELFDIIPQGTEKKVFFNIIGVKNPELAKYKADAKGQEKRIMKIFEDGNKYTPLAIERITGINHDSAKRAITCLTKQCKLIKLGKEEMILESKGKKNHQWVINK